MVTGEEAYARFARALRDYLGNKELEGEITLVLVFILTLLIFWFLFSILPNPRRKYHASAKDLDFFDMVIYQKGMEAFDRDLLLDVAQTFEVAPVYQILLDEKEFEKVLAKIRAETEKKQTASKFQSNITYLLKVKSRLFQKEEKD